MYIVRETFIAKPGRAGALADLMKNEMKNWKDFKGHVLLDIVTNYNKIVVEYEVKSLADFEKGLVGHKKKMLKTKESSKKLDYRDMYLTGYREIYRVV